MNKSVLLTSIFVASALSISLFAAEAQQKNTQQAPQKNAQPQPQAKPAAAAPAAPAKSAATGAKVTLTGCPSIGMPPTCVLMKGGDGASYEVGGSRMALPFDGSEVRLTGTATANVSICMKGVVLKDVEWAKTGKKCKA